MRLRWRMWEMDRFTPTATFLIRKRTNFISRSACFGVQVPCKYVMLSATCRKEILVQEPSAAPAPLVVWADSEGVELAASAEVAAESICLAVPLSDQSAKCRA